MYTKRKARNTTQNNFNHNGTECATGQTMIPWRIVCNCIDWRWNDLNKIFIYKYARLASHTTVIGWLWLEWLWLEWLNIQLNITEANVAEPFARTSRARIHKPNFDLKFYSFHINLADVRWRRMRRRRKRRRRKKWNVYYANKWVVSPKYWTHSLYA